MSSIKSLWQKLKSKTGGKSFVEVIGFVLERALRVFLAKIYLRTCSKVGQFVSINKRPKIVNKGYLEIGDEVRIWSNINQSKLFVEKGGSLIIGKNSRINGVHISASTEVKIGENVRIAPYVIIIDDDYHDVEDHFGATGKKSPIVIEDNVWIAMDAKILKGVRIGKGSVVATSAVVTRDVPPFSIVAGIPAKVIKQIKPY
jgi:acetyltransferase-like isoleucine patch superfamily enzyme